MATVPRGIGHFFSVPVLGFSVSGLTSRTTSDDCKDGYRVFTEFYSVRRVVLCHLYRVSVFYVRVTDFYRVSRQLWSSCAQSFISFDRFIRDWIN